jgi:alkylated DNA repair dioxygenase AlkB
MNSLFPEDDLYPPGFRYFPDFLTIQEEEDILVILEQIQTETFIFQGFEAKRKAASFGYDYHFDNRRLTKGKPIPDAFQPVIKKVAEVLRVAAEDIKELLVLEYPVGAVINWHRDAPPFDVIAGLSLLTDCTFKLRPYDKTKHSRKSVISFPVKRRSLYILSGEVRNDWEHSTAPVKEKRYSITFRTLRE